MGSWPHHPLVSWAVARLFLAPRLRFFICAMRMGLDPAEVPSYGDTPRFSKMSQEKAMVASC